MLNKTFFSYICLIAALHAAEVEQVISTQDQLNKFCAQSSMEVYKNINENVEFSAVHATNSAHWETQTVLTHPFFVKKRGIPLSEALNDLINGHSKTSFECDGAFCINVWKILIPFQMDKIVADIEAKHEIFFFPLITNGQLLVFENYARYYGFSRRDGAFTYGTTSINIKDQYNQIVRVRSWLDKLPMFSAFKPVPKNTSRPCKTIEGGILYLSNAEGVKGVGKGENLFCVDAVNGLYYGFGPSFKTGPQKLFDIAMDLQTYALKDQAEQYWSGITKSLMALGIGNILSPCHVLQYLVDPNTCLFLSLVEVEKQLPILDDIKIIKII